MSETTSTPAVVPGAIVWTDLTVADAPRVRDFYSQVVGWSPEPVAMGEYDDYSMKASNGVVAAGVCHARGSNASLPAQWLIYVTVADMDASVARAQELGGRVIDGPRSIGAHRICVIQDPAGAVFGLIQS